MLRYVLLATLFLSALSAQAQLTMDDFAAIWLFNEDGKDVSENEYHAELKNGAKIENGSLMLDGKSWAEMPNQAAFQAQGGVTLLARVFPTTINREDAFFAHMILAKGNEYLLRIDPPDQGNMFAAFFYVNEDWRPAAAEVKPEENVWAFVAATYEPTEGDEMNVKLYVDGKLKAQANRKGKILTTDNLVEIGRWEDFSYFIGAIDEAAIMKRPATEEEIRLLHKTGLEGFSQGLNVEPTGRLAVSWGELKA